MTVKTQKTKSEKTAIAIRLPDEWIERLDRIAAKTQRSRAGVAQWLLVLGVVAFEDNPAGVFATADRLALPDDSDE